MDYCPAGHELSESDINDDGDGIWCPDCAEDIPMNSIRDEDDMEWDAATARWERREGR